MLTIVIPTFNRSDFLAKSLHALIPQLTENTELYILDNASTDATPAVAKKAQEANLQKKIIYKRNNVNIGANANVLRSFEQCSSGSDWLWILGDDDLVSSDSIEIISNITSANPGAQYIEFSSGLEDKPPLAETQFRTIDALLSSEFFSFSNFLFISSGVYNAGIIDPNLRFGYHYQFTFAPHLCVLLSAIALGYCNIVMSPIQLIIWEKNPGQVWDHEYLVYRLGQIVQILPSQRSRQLLCKRIYQKSRFMSPVTLPFVLNLLANPRVTQEHLHICAELIYFANWWNRYFALLLLVRLFQLLGIGRLARIAIKIYKKVTKKNPYILPSAFRGRGALGFPGF